MSCCSQLSMNSMAGSPIDYDQDGDVEDDDLARASQNPVANMISLPMKKPVQFRPGR